MACYYVVISSTHLRDGQLRSIKGVFRGPIGASGAKSEVETGTSLYCELCNKQYERQQQYDNHTSSYDHHHRQRLKELKQREFYRLLGSRRHRRGKEQSQHSVKGHSHSVAGLGPMFRSTTVALDGSEDDQEVLSSHIKEPVTSQWSHAQWLSCRSGEQDLSTVVQPRHRTHNNQPSCTPSGTNTHMSTSAHLWSRTQVRPVCFSLPKRCSTLCHQSAAVFLQTSKESITKKPNNVDLINSSVGTGNPVNEAYDDLKQTQEKSKTHLDNSKSTLLHRPKEPFYRVLSRDSATVLLWPSEMVSYTRTSPSISFSVNPLLHNFRAPSTTTNVPVDKRAEPEKSEPFVIKRFEQQQRQTDAQEGGAQSRHERERGNGGGQTASAAEVEAHCNSSNYDESALNLHSNSDFERHLVLPGRKRKRKRTKRGWREMKRRRKMSKIKKRRSRPHSQNKRPRRQSNGSNAREIANQAASDGHKRAELLSHLPVSHFNRCNQLCSQVNSQARHHLPQQSVSEWGQGFRKRHSGEATCSTAISLVPGSDIEIPRCPAIIPCAAQSCTYVWEAHVETPQGENHVVQEDAIKEQELVGKRTFDDAFNQETLCCHNKNVPVGKSTANHTSLSCDPITEKTTIALTNSGETQMIAKIKRQPKKKLKKTGRCMDNGSKLMCISSDLSMQSTQETQVKTPTTQMVTTIVKTNSNTGSHFQSRSSLCVDKACITTCSCCHSSTLRVMESSCTDYGSYSFEECQNTTSETNNAGGGLIAENTKTQVEEPHCTAAVSKRLTDLSPAETLSCQFKCSNHFTNCNCTEKDTNEEVVNVVLISPHPEQTRKEDEMKQVQEIITEVKREENKSEEKMQERRKMERSDRTNRDRTCLPLPPPYLLHQRFVPLSQPMSPYPPFTCHYSLHLPLLPPLLPLAMYSSAPVPLLDGPYSLPVFHSIQSDSPALYGPPPPALVPTQLIFSKSAAFSIS